jgi:hypothetical protein
MGGFSRLQFSGILAMMMGTSPFLGVVYLGLRFEKKPTGVYKKKN